MTTSAKQQIAEIRESLNEKGVKYNNEVTGVWYSVGNANMKAQQNGKYKFYSDLDKMAKDIFKSMNTGI
jgi:hypothetical protein